MNRQSIMYFPNWKLNSPGGNVSDIPWDKISFLNHAFWKVAPKDADKEASYIRREKGLNPRTDFEAVSTGPDADRIIFNEYRKYHELYPDVHILISIGGWTMCGFLSEMSYTAQGRTSFIESLVSLIKENPWLDGIDIDWEYPGGDGKGERLPSGSWEEACPIWGTVSEDKENFTKLIKEMREAFDQNFTTYKYVTACAAGFERGLVNQDWKAVSESIDFINIMTYDLMWLKEGKAWHASGISDTRKAIDYFMSTNVPASKINIGSPFYATAVYLQKDTDFSNIVGSDMSDEPVCDKDILTVDYIKSLKNIAVTENVPGWHEGYDEVGGGSYLYNDDPSSCDFRKYISFESHRTIDAKFDLINEYGLAGIIVWETTHDTADHEYASHIHSLCVM